MGRYAENTEVTVERSKTEIERLLVRYKADQFMYGWSEDAATIGFRISDRFVRITLPLPNRLSEEFTKHSRGYREAGVAEKMWEQACRQRWRALALVIKAKLEAVESTISTIEREFFVDLMIPGGQTIGQIYGPQIARAYEKGIMPKSLPGLDEPLLLEAD